MAESPPDTDAAIRGGRSSLPGPAGKHHGDGGRAIRRIAKAGSANLAGAALSAAVNFLLIVVVTRSWDPGTAGALFAVSSIFLISLALAQLGVDQGLVRFIAWNTARGDAAKNRHLVVIGFGTAAAAGSVVAALGVLVSHPLATLLGEESAASTRSMIVVFACALPVAAAYELVLAITRGTARMLPTILLERILRPILQLGCILAVGAAGLAPGFLAAAWVAPYAVGLGAAVIALGRILRANPGILSTTSGTKAAERRTMTAEFWRFTVPRGFSRLAQVMIQRADIAIVTILAGPAAGAVYTAVTRFLVLGQLASSALQQVSEPQLARLLAKGKRADAGMVTRRLTLWIILLAWPIYLLILVYAEVLLELVFGAGYEDGATSLRILAAAMLFATAIGPLDVLLLMAGRSSLSLINTTAALVIDVALCLLLIPALGFTGAAVAWACAIVTRNILAYCQVRGSLGITSMTLPSSLLAGLVVLLFGVAPFIAHNFGAQAVIELVVLLGAVLVYGTVAWLCRRHILPSGSGAATR
ncbi:O-antigen/teichoic acid export membrane protein [Arthrobacter sp. CAN_A6]|uniref:lipopolysaccharide biosynthesis protein n=1 Tax=Arthrobacter sp. CAN_A6 TaxID=2787721 RepID=UPI0018C9362D